jgi:hypothetical protein
LLLLLHLVLAPHVLVHERCEGASTEDAFCLQKKHQNLNFKCGNVCEGFTAHAFEHAAPCYMQVFYAGFTRAFLKGEAGKTSADLLQEAKAAVDEVSHVCSPTAMPHQLLLRAFRQMHAHYACYCLPRHRAHTVRCPSFASNAHTFK